jgi:hypothetical protein
MMTPIATEFKDLQENKKTNLLNGTIDGTLYIARTIQALIRSINNTLIRSQQLELFISNIPSVGKAQMLFQGL